MKQRPKILGLVGGVASGKTTVARLFGRLGAAVVDADRIAHEVLQQPFIRDHVRQEWGDDVLDDEGRVDRTKLGQIVFQDPQQIAKLNAVVHPRVLEVMRQQMEAARERGAPCTVVDAALLVESGLDAECDVIAFIDAPEAHRGVRAQRDRGWSASEVARREAHQAPLGAKRRIAQYVVHNDGRPDELLAQVRQVWEQVVG